MLMTVLKGDLAVRHSKTPVVLLPYYIAPYYSYYNIDAY